MFRESVALVVGILVVSLSLSRRTGKPEVSPEASSKPEKIIEASGPREVTDHGGHKAQIPAKIEKVAFEQIPLMPTFMALHDGKAPGLVAVNKHTVNQMDGTILAEKVPEALKVDTSFDDAGAPNGEPLAAIKPDVVFDNCFNKKNNEIVDAVGLPRVGLSTMGAPTETYVKWLELLEDVYGEPGKMDDKIAAGKKLIDDARARVSKINAGQRKSVMVVMKAAPGKLIIAEGRPGWFTDSWANRVNFNSVATGSEQGFMPVSAEQIAAWNPDVILVTGKGMSSIAAKEILNNQIEGLDLSGLRAVQNKQVYTARLGMWNWFTSNPDVPVVANWVGQKLYPEQFKDVDLVKIVQEHYKTAYGWDLGTAKAEKILDPNVQTLHIQAMFKIVADGRLRLWFVVTLGILVVLCALSVIVVGRYSVSPTQLISVFEARFAGKPAPDQQTDSIVMSARLPRVILALLIGSGLTVTGAAFQPLFSNPLATPDILGVTAGTCVGAVIGLTLEWNMIGVQLLALIFGLGAVTTATSIARQRGQPSIMMLILAGVVVSAVANAIISILKPVADPTNKLPETTYWLMGSLSGVHFEAITLSVPLIIVDVAAIYLLCWHLNILALSEDEARASGINVRVLCRVIIVAAMLITASVVSMCGQVDWIGLLVPYCARMLVGNNNRLLIPTSLFLGRSLTVIIDTLTRSATEAETPISVSTALTGAPFSITLLCKTGENQQ